MDDRERKENQRRIGRLERESARVRIGVVVDDTPLSVALGGSDVALSAVALGSYSPTIADRVACLRWGKDLLVLGVLP